MALIIVSGAVANKPFNGGEAWVRLNWILGLKKLGHEVLFIEQLAVSDTAETCAHELGDRTARQVEYFDKVVSEFGLQHQSALLDGQGRRVWGTDERELIRLAQRSAALINISGHLQSRPLLERIAKKVYVDLDPGFTQFWQEQGNLGARLEGHDYYFTVGENIGAAGCSIPTNGIRWRPVRQPVVLDEFPVVTARPPWRFTTVGSWRGSFGPVEAGGRTFGQKVHEFRKFVELPRLVEHPFEIALDIHPAEEKDLALLSASGWKLVDPVVAAGDPQRFRTYVQQSGAEFSVAQGMYVDTNSGWFSDRTVRYLASGRPALVQETGFSRILPAGEGLLAFSSMQEAVDGVNALVEDYPRHCWAARRIAEKHFDSSLVLGRLLEEIGVAGPQRVDKGRRTISAEAAP